MPAFKSLADSLGVEDPPRPADRPDRPDIQELVDITDPKEFCQRVLQTREFRQYIVNGFVLGDLPAAVACRVIDHAWGKPPDRVEHTGKDGQPIVTEVRRVIVHARDESFDSFDDDKASDKLTH